MTEDPDVLSLCVFLSNKKNRSCLVRQVEKQNDIFTDLNNTKAPMVLAVIKF